jgi:hypothetical protein
LFGRHIREQICAKGVEVSPLLLAQSDDKRLSLLDHEGARGEVLNHLPFAMGSGQDLDKRERHLESLHLTSLLELGEVGRERLVSMVLTGTLGGTP